MKYIIKILGLGIALGIVWYLGAPLFIDEVVDEEFPVVAEQTMEEKMKKMEQLTAEEVENMTPEEQQKMKKEMEDLGKKMPNTEVADVMPDEENSDEQSGPSAISKGIFVGADSLHKGSGTATLYALADGSYVLRFEDFSVTNGPALSVFLTKADGTRLDLGKLKGNMGNQNYPISADIMVEEYDGVLIYCVPFKVKFATAELN